MRKIKKDLNWFGMSRAQLVNEVGLLRDDELDRLPVGAVCLTREGSILACNEVQANFIGSRRRELIGRNFFDEVVHSARVPGFHGRFLTGALSGTLDLTFPFTFRLLTGWKRALVRMVSDSDTGLVWLFIEPAVDRFDSLRRPCSREVTERQERLAS
ncbi:MAG: hypothetical protein R3338_07600 [Thermoanaerobaculia bacterium]|nr:hypothetical protein [Thermoanaerobaculia bacterium]